MDIKSLKYYIWKCLENEQAKLIKDQWDDQINSCLSVCLQLFWEKRLKGLRSSDVTEQVLRTMDLPKGLQSRSPTTAWIQSFSLSWPLTHLLISFSHWTGVGPDASDDTLLSAIASALHMSSAPITGQTSVAAEKNPAIWLNTSQPLCKAFTVTDEHIR